MDLNWTAAGVIVAFFIALIGWLLPSPIQMQNRLAHVERELAVLVSTVNLLRQTVDDWIKYTRGNGNGGNDTGRRTRV